MGSSAGAGALGAGTGGAMGSAVGNAQTFGALAGFTQALLGGNATGGVAAALDWTRLGFGHPSGACRHVAEGTAAVDARLRGGGARGTPPHVLRALWLRGCASEETLFWAVILGLALLLVHVPATMVAGARVARRRRAARRRLVRAEGRLEMRQLHHGLSGRGEQWRQMGKLRSKQHLPQHDGRRTLHHGLSELPGGGRGPRGPGGPRGDPWGSPAPAPAPTAGDDAFDAACVDALRRAEAAAATRGGGAAEAPGLRERFAHTYVRTPPFV